MLLVSLMSVTAAPIECSEFCCSYVPHKGALTWDQTKEFLGGIRTGTKAGVKLQGELADPVRREPWNGKDGEAPQEDEFSLEDIMGS
jgi:hypothetical protein